MSKKVIILLLGIVLIFISVFLFFKDSIYFEQEKEEELQINFINEGEKIEVILDNNTIYSLTISDFKTWAKENWDSIFEETPAFGDLREVEVDNFYSFHNTAIISPLKNYLAFSVSDYAALTDISFVGIVELNEKEISLISKENIGSVQTMLFSPEEKYIAYNLDTARAQGDYLTVDNALNRTKEITISEKEILSAINSDCNEVYPQFSNLYFRNDNELYFTAQNCDEEKIEWILNIADKEIHKKDVIN